MKETIEEIVRQVLQEYLKQQTIAQKPPNHKLFILVDHQPTGDNITEEVWSVIQSLSHHYQITVCAPKSYKIKTESLTCKSIILCKNYIEEIKQEIEETDALLLLNTTYAHLAKLALSIDDTLGIWITIQVQLEGKKVVLVTDQLNVKGTKKVTTPHTVDKRIQSYLRQLQEDRIQLVSLAKLQNWLDSYFENGVETRHVVLAKHIEDVVHDGGNELIVPKNSLITPMCKDFAREMGVSIKQKE